MMHDLTMDQRNLYKQYANLGKKIIENVYPEQKTGDEIIWNAIAKEGIWTLPVAKEYGGKGGSWQDTVVAMDGIFEYYFNTDFLDLFISQISAIYLVTQYGTSTIKNSYLARLMGGEIITIYHQYSHSNKKIKKTSLFNKNKICIYIREIEKSLIFYIYEKKSSFIDNETFQSLKPVLNTENMFVAKDVGVSALYDLLDFERLFYAVISARFASKVCVETHARVLLKPA